jgi:uncharacterized protein (UPF0276 family)
MRVGLSLQPQDDYRQAAEPLLTAGDVDVLEWTVDNGWAQPLPGWVKPWLVEFGERDALYAHGFSFSLMSGRWTERHKTWLKLISMETQLRRYRHLSEHFCFVTAGDFEASAPMPVPLTDKTLALGQARLKKLREASGLPVGLENLAIAFGEKDVREQGAFLTQLLEPVDGFMLLDVHNLYCQLHNFSMSAEELLDTYPLERVREIHVSGGSWDEVEGGTPFRRDTHDEAVPEQVFELTTLALHKCPNVEVVFFERLGGTIHGEQDMLQFRADYARLKEVVHADP